MSQALYRKYRSKKLSEVVGQTHITDTLAAALQKNQISHAYLFTGPRGTGKTSVARILAHDINEFPYDEETTQLDIIEIDAASNRGIEEIRDLREKAALAPTSGKYKVYIIDEVHMLTPPAFNALLKTLEEPPKHVVFILATTELHKLPETIVSRAQRFGFRPIDTADMIPHLRMIAEAEGIKINDEALELIASHARGGFRDAISLLDQVSGGDAEINRDYIAEIIGLPPLENIESIVSSVAKGDRSTGLNKISELLSEGYNPGMIADILIEASRNKLLSGTLEPEALDRLMILMEGVLSSSQSANPRVALELTIIKSAGAVINIAPSESTKKLEPKIIKNIKKTENIIVESTNEEEKIAEESTSNTKLEKETNFASDSDNDLWNKVLNSLRGSHNTLYGILRMAEAEIDQKKQVLTLRFQFPFHMKRAAETKHANIISQTIYETTNKNYEIRYEKRNMNTRTGSASKTPKGGQDESKSDATDNNNEAMTAVISVFGKAELV